jgi:hypothetical protein
LINLIVDGADIKSDGWLVDRIVDNIFLTDKFNIWFLEYILDEKNLLEFMVDKRIYYKLINSENISY